MREGALLKMGIDGSDAKDRIKGNERRMIPIIRLNPIRPVPEIRSSAILTQT